MPKPPGPRDMSAATASRSSRSQRLPRATEDARQVDGLCAELACLLERRTGTDGGHETAIPELKLYRFSNPTEPAHVLQQPAVYVVVQGRKKVVVGDETYFYDPSQYLAV